MFLIINIVIWICGGKLTGKLVIVLSGLALILDSIILNQCKSHSHTSTHYHTETSFE